MKIKVCCKKFKEEVIDTIYHPVIVLEDDGDFKILTNIDFDCHGCGYSTVYYCPWCGRYLGHRENWRDENENIDAK